MHKEMHRGYFRKYLNPSKVLEEGENGSTTKNKTVFAIMRRRFSIRSTFIL